MEPDLLAPRALASTESFDARLRDVFSFRAAIPVLNEYLATIEIDDDNPAFVPDWDLTTLHAFVAAANCQRSGYVPPWLRTAPPHITTHSFTDDFVHLLQQHAGGGGRCGRLLLAPNNLSQFGRIAATLGMLQRDTFLQDAAQMALPVINNVEQCFATMYCLIEPRV